MSGNIETIIRKLQLKELPLEGGLYCQTYISDYSTAIYYMLTGEAFSHFHRLPYDEVYHFYLGDPVCLWELTPEGEAKMTILGQDIVGGEKVQYAVKAGNWQGSCRLAAFPGRESESGCGYSLLGTTMAPGYSDECYEHGDAEKLLAEYPGAEMTIRRLCW